MLEVKIAYLNASGKNVRFYIDVADDTAAGDLAEQVIKEGFVFTEKEESRGGEVYYWTTHIPAHRITMVSYRSPEHNRGSR